MDTYTVAVIRKGQQPAPHTVPADSLAEAAYDLIRSEGSTLTAQDRDGVAALVAKARQAADEDSFVALSFGAAHLTIRPSRVAV